AGSYTELGTGSLHAQFFKFCVDFIEADFHFLADIGYLS
ncbi:hypothetical protein SSYM_0314, partial [Serratia symbiotica str. Tucson]